MNSQKTKTVVVPQLLLASAALLWAGNFVVGRLVRGDLPPVTLGFWRWALALVILLPMSFEPLRRHRKLILAHWKLVISLGVTSIAAYPVFVYQALTETTALNTLLLLSTVPLLISLAAWLVSREPITAAQGLGMLLSLAGAVVSVAHGDLTTLSHLEFNRGDLWMLAALPLWAIYAILLKRRPAQLPPLPLLTASVIAGMLMLTPVYIWQVAHGEYLVVNVSNALALLYVAVFVSALGYILWNKGAAELGANQAGVFVHLIPTFGALLSVVFLGERIAVYHLIAATLVIGGIGLASWRRAVRQPLPRGVDRQADMVA